MAFDEGGVGWLEGVEKTTFGLDVLIISQFVFFCLLKLLTDIDVSRKGEVASCKLCEEFLGHSVDVVIEAEKHLL